LFWNIEGDFEVVLRTLRYTCKSRRILLSYVHCAQPFAGEDDTLLIISSCCKQSCKPHIQSGQSVSNAAESRKGTFNGARALMCTKFGSHHVTYCKTYERPYTAICSQFYLLSDYSRTNSKGQTYDALRSDSTGTSLAPYNR
jgi:hypothetical protein